MNRHFGMNQADRQNSFDYLSALALAAFSAHNRRTGETANGIWFDRPCLPAYNSMLGVFGLIGQAAACWRWWRVGRSARAIALRLALAEQRRGIFLAPL